MLIKINNQIKKINNPISLLGWIKTFTKINFVQIRFQKSDKILDRVWVNVIVKSEIREKCKIICPDPFKF